MICEFLQCCSNKELHRTAVQLVSVHLSQFRDEISPYICWATHVHADRHLKCRGLLQCCTMYSSELHGWLKQPQMSNRIAEDNAVHLGKKVTDKGCFQMYTKNKGRRRKNFESHSLGFRYTNRDFGFSGVARKK